MAQVKDNLVELKGVVDKLNKALDENIKRLNDGATAVGNFTRSFNNIPSQYLQLLSDLADKNKALQDTQKRLLDVEKELERLRQRQNTTSRERVARTSEEIVNQRALAQQADRQTRATSALVGAYANLNAQHQIASSRLQNLIARGRTATQTQSQYNRELRNAQRDFDSLNRRVLSADQAVGRFNRNVGNYPRQAIVGMKDLIGAFGIVGGVSLIAGVAKDIFQTTKELQSLNNALKQVTDTQANFTEQQQFLARISEAYGVELKGLTKQFTQFYVSAKDKISGREIQQIFESVTKAGASMGLSVEAQERAFLALNQMMSKGTVSAEELRGQLGEALPGAFGIMAKAIGVTEKQLGQMMKDGEVLASDVLPRFAKQLEITYGIENVNRVENLASAQTRLGNAWTSFTASLDEGGNKLSKFFSLLLDEATSTLKVWQEIFTSAETKREKYLKSVKQSGKNLAEENLKIISDKQQREEYATNKIIELEKKKNVLYAKANELVRKNKEISESKDPNVRDSNSGELRRYWEKEVNKNQIQLAKYNNEINLTQGLINGYSSALEKKKPIVKEDIELTKAQLKSINDLKKAEEERLKNLYERELSDLERKKDISQANFEDEKQYAEKRIQLSEDVALYENLIALRKFQENLRLHKDSLDLQKIDANNYQTEQEEIVKRSENRILKIRKDNFDAFTEYRQKYGKLADEEIYGTGTTFLPTDELDKLILGYEKLNEEKVKSKKLTEDETKAINDFLLSFTEGVFSDAGLPTLFKVLNNEIDGFGENWKTTFVAIAEIAQEAFNFISDASNANFENEYNNLEKQKETALLFAGDSAGARDEIERQAEEKRRKIAEREFKAQKSQALFNIAVNTAQAIMATYAKLGFPKGIPLAIAMGAIGLAQAGIVASREIPQYFTGTDNAKEGFALTQERGREIIMDRFGKIKDLGSDDGARLTKMKAGDKVLNNEKTMELLMFNSQFNSKLAPNLNTMPNLVVNNNTDFTPIIKAIQNKPETILNFDNGEFKKFVRNGNSIKETTQIRNGFKGLRV